MKGAAILCCLCLIAAKPAKPLRPPPLVRMTAPPLTIKNAFTSGMWTANDFGDYTLAGTLNDSGSAFGILCGTTCVYYVNFQRSCTIGVDYPAMINSPAGAYAITMRCYHIDDRNVLTFEAKENSFDVLSKGGEIGFAAPLQSGQFGVSRFSLTGGLATVMKALEWAVQKRNAQQKGLRDFTI